MSTSTTLDLLCLATTALRDLREGYPPGEIAAPDGALGLDALLQGLVRQLREQGIDDDGGWTCDATQDIPVAVRAAAAAGVPVVVLRVDSAAILDLASDHDVRVIILDSDTEAKDASELRQVDGETVQVLDYRPFDGAAARADDLRRVLAQLEASS